MPASIQEVSLSRLHRARSRSLFARPGAMASIVKARKRHAAEVCSPGRTTGRGKSYPWFRPSGRAGIEFTNANHRALNLATGNYVTAATRPARFQRKRD